MFLRGRTATAEKCPRRMAARTLRPVTRPRLALSRTNASDGRLRVVLPTTRTRRPRLRMRRMRSRGEVGARRARWSGEVGSPAPAGAVVGGGVNGDGALDARSGGAAGG